MQQVPSTSTSSSALTNGTHTRPFPSYSPASKPATSRMTAQEPSSGPSSQDPPDISTSELEAKLQSLREQSNKLSQELTQRLATSESGQNLMQIGPSLSTLPPDLHSLIACVQPLLNEVEDYVETNANELDRLHQYQVDIESSSTRARHARQCVALYEDLSAGERDVKRDLTLQKKESASTGGSSDAALEDGKDDCCSFLEHVASLERAAHITLHLLQELEHSTAQLSAAITTKPNPQQQQQHSKSPLMVPTTEKAQFLSKLAPRILKLESDATKCLISRLDSILTRMAQDPKRQSPQIRGSGSSSTKHAQEDLLAIGHCLRGLALLGKGKEAESVFARVAIMPLLRSKVSIGRIDEGGSRGECAGLFSLLDDITCSISSNFGPVLCLSECIFGFSVSLGKDVKSGAGEVVEQQSRRVDVDLVTAGVWIPIATTLMADPAMKMAIFSPGIASVLQANFMALDIFVSELADRLLSSSSTDKDSQDEASFKYSDCKDMTQLYHTAKVCPAAVKAAQSRIFRHPTTAEFSKKWNLPIYYQLRFGERCTRLNRAIARVQREGWGAAVFTGSSSEATLLREKLGFEVPLFMELYDILSSLWKPDVVLRPLTHRFLRGAVQLLGRMVAFAKDGLEGQVLFGTPSFASSENGQNSESGSVQYSWGERAEDVAAVAWEMTVLERTMTNDYLDAIVSAVAPKEMGQQSNVHNTEAELEELRTLISELLLEASQEMSPFISKCWMEVISGILTSKCCTPLSAVKGVAATYRMTNRPPPTQSSPFVSTILRPLKEFDDVFQSRTPPQVGSEWKRNVVGTVSERYSLAVEELLETVRRTEEALKSRKARRSTAVGMSDGDKVKLQLLLDYKEFAKGVADVGVDGATVDGVRKLKSLTEEAESLLTHVQNGAI